jgi:hypothetical protein
MKEMKERSREERDGMKENYKMESSWRYKTP